MATVIGAMMGEEEGVQVSKWGYPVRTSSRSCIASIDSYFHQILTYGRNRSVITQAAHHDPNCLLANLLAAHFLSSSDPPLARLFLASANSSYDRGTPYEKAVFHAVSYLISDRKDDDVAIDLHAKLLTDFPRDLASLKRAQILCFYSGQPNRCLDLVNQVKHANRDASYFYGMLAFPLLELGEFEDAEEAAKMALQINKQDVWAQHCLCHVLQQKCRFEEAVRFMEDCSHTWESCSSFMYTHNWWHVALCYLEGNASSQKVLELYENGIIKELEKPDATVPEVYLNALGLLLRMHVRGQIGLFESHVKILVPFLSCEDTWHVEWYLDLLSIWALSYLGELRPAEDLVEGLRCRVSKMNKKKRLLMEKGLLLADAMYEYGRGNDKQALVLFGMDFDTKNYKMIGASDEQLDVFNEIWYCLLLNNGHSQNAIDPIERRIAEREGVPFLWRLLEKSYKMSGKEEEASTAAKKAKMLENSYFK